MIYRCVCALPNDVIVHLLFGGTGRPDWSSRKENTFINQDIPYKPVFPVRTAVKGPLAKPGEKVHFFFFSQNHRSGRPVLTFCERPKLWETLRLRFFGISRERKKSRDQGLTVRFAVWGSRLYGRPRSRGKWFSARFFCNLKHHNPTFEKKYDFLELFCSLIIEFDFEQK